MLWYKNSRKTGFSILFNVQVVKYGVDKEQGANKNEDDWDHY